MKTFLLFKQNGEIEEKITKSKLFDISTSLFDKKYENYVKYENYIILHNNMYNLSYLPTAFSIHFLFISPFLSFLTMVAS